MLSMQEFNESMALAERMAKLSLDRGKGNGKVEGRFARSFMGLEGINREEEEAEDVTLKPYVPPRQLLLYMVRMGSFTSKPPVSAGDIQDDDVKLPEAPSHLQVLEWCRGHLKEWPGLLDRTFVSAPFQSAHISNEETISSFRIMTWNILADALGSHADALVKCPPDALHWKKRRFRILEEILSYEPDIVCLQEVDHYKFIKKVLNSQGYEGIFFPKPDSPCIYLPSNNGPDGCAFFYKSNKFALSSVQTRVLEVWHVQSNQVAILATLQEVNSGQELDLISTHLKARKGALLATLRNEQGNDLISFLEDNCLDNPAIICGDFNAEPSEPVYTTMTKDFTSAYSHLLDGEPPYTTWKIRESGEQMHTIDYIFYKGRGLSLDGGFTFSSDKNIGPSRLPSFSYPSDHFSLICDFSFKRKMASINDQKGL